MAEKQGSLLTLNDLDAEQKRQHCISAVRQARQSVQQGFDGQEAPGRLLSSLARDLDRLLGELYRGARLPERERIALVALGGHGRGEIYPYSDLDLLVLHEGEADEVTTHLVEQVVYPLWDARVSVQHVVRGIDETLHLAEEDLTVRTALLDARLLAGDEDIFEAFQQAMLSHFFGPERVGQFVEALQQERAGRHRRFGETEYLLEPNVKNSKGGLRDLNTGLWAAKARFGLNDLDELQPLGAATQRQVKALKEAQQFLQRLRLAMHLTAGRAQDHLQFDLQETLAPRLFPQVDVPGVTRRVWAVEPAVERLMHAFYRHARVVVLETGRILERCIQRRERAYQPSGTPATSRRDEHFQLVEGRLFSSDPQRFWQQPSEILRAFWLLLDMGIHLDHATQDAMAEAVADEPGAQLKVDEEAIRIWLQILCHPEQPGSVSVLEEMHHLGVIGALIPEFEPCTGRIQHDLYHVFTVDLHSLYAVALLKAFRRKELSDQYPSPVAVMERIEELEGLMLAALLHDVAKPLGRGHSAKGARLAAGVAARLGLEVEQQQEVRFLVEHHLTMAHLSQRRDLSDPTVIASFASLVGTTDRLRKLLLVTVADTAMTGPGNLNEWKATLLNELFMKTYLHLTRGKEAGEQELREHLRQQRDALELALRRQWGPPGGELVGRVPTEMLQSCGVEDLVHHLGAAMELEQSPAAVVCLKSRSRGGSATELTICCPDAPGLLATITGVMLGHRIEILAAQVYTLEAGGDGSGTHVVDVFSVQAPVEAGAETWKSLTADLQRAIRGDLSVAELVRSYTRPSGLPPKVIPHVETVVTVDNDASDRLTVIDVQAPDRLGILYAITRTLSEEGLVIHLSKVATEAGRVIDNFYVSDGQGGGKIVDERRLEQVCQRVKQAIGALMPTRVV